MQRRYIRATLLPVVILLPLMPALMLPLMLALHARRSAGAVRPADDGRAAT